MRNIFFSGSIANCGEAELVIYDGYSNIDVNPVLLKRYCGDLKYYKNTEEKTQLSRRNRIVVRLRTTVASPQRHEGEIIGFKLVWTAVTFANRCEQFTCGKVRSRFYCCHYHYLTIIIYSFRNGYFNRENEIIEMKAKVVVICSALFV